ncbi:MAG: glycosyltransferase [Bacteroidota bacterium]
MNILVVCRASTEIGLGHMVRSKTFSEKLCQLYPELKLSLYVVGDPALVRLFTGSYVQPVFVADEKDIKIGDARLDIIFFDSISLSAECVQQLKSKTDLAVSLSPIFNQMHLMDVLFTRTKYAFDGSPVSVGKLYNGLEYTIVRPDCYKIDTANYISGLTRNSFFIGVSMGGGDAANKSLQIVRALKDCQIPATIWVMLGEGYKHSYDQLIDAVEKDSEHEIILAKTNKSMWNVLNNCSLLITTSGITSYEAVYAGLPTITFYDSPDQFYLIRELLEKDIAINGGLYNADNLQRLSKLLLDVYNNKARLTQMHKKAIKLIDEAAPMRIFEIAKNELKNKRVTV